MELGVFADDLTGGMIIASLLEQMGVRCPLVTSVDALEALTDGFEAVVLARKVRFIDPSEARAEATTAAAAFKALGAKRLYYKYSALFDSTPAGNIGPIAEALMLATGANRTLFCPAFVEADVTVFEGRLFVRGVPVNESAKRHDPLAPMPNANLVEVLQAQTPRKVGLLRHRVLAEGVVAIAAEIERQGETPFFVVDAIDAQDVTAIVELARDWPLMTGADSLPPALARAWQGDRRRGDAAHRRLLPPAPGYAVVLSGSCSATTLAQLADFAVSNPIWYIDLALDGERPTLVAQIIEWATVNLSAGPVAIATLGAPANVAEAQQRYGREGAASLADRLLGEIARGLLGRGVCKFVVAGGETSGAVVAALDIKQFEIASFDDMLGGYCHQSSPVAISMVLKPGSFGDSHFLSSAVARMLEADEANSS